MESGDPREPKVETDDRFPSGPWTGFFLQQVRQGRNWMELRLMFRDGIISGEGRDRVGEFLFRGRYELSDGTCHWTKSYIGRHDVFYKGFNEGKGIWGVWTIDWAGMKGGFHIWPEGMADPTSPTMAAEAEAPADPIEEAIGEPIGVGAGAEPIGAEPIGAADLGRWT